MYKPVIINGFDRSGTSAITRLLSSHNTIELIMQPFNSGLVREKMYEEFNEPNTSEVYKLLKGFVEGEIKEEYIHSHWHYKYSTSRVYDKKKLYIIKTTINHLAQKWMNDNFASIDVWGIWRNPFDIVSSIINNDFYSKWYEDGIEKMIPTIHQVKILEIYSTHLEELNTDIKKTAFLVAVRSFYFFYYLKGERIIEYEKFNTDANYLNKFISYYGLEEINFKQDSNIDLNIIGKRNIKELKINEDELDFINRVFKPLNELILKKVND